LKKLTDVTNENFSKMLYNFTHNIINNKCKICENDTHFISYKKGYRKYCSKKCIMNDEILIKKK